MLDSCSESHHAAICAIKPLYWMHLGKPFINTAREGPSGASFGSRSQGRFTRLSQQFQIGSCDDNTQNRFRRTPPRQDEFAGQAKHNPPRAARYVLVLDPPGVFQRRGCGSGRHVCTCWQSLVSGGRKHATIAISAFGEAAFDRVLGLGVAKASQPPATPTQIKG